MSATKDLINLVWGLGFEQLTEADTTATSRLLLDHIGVAANGAASESARVMQAFVARRGSTGPQLPVIGTGLKVEAVAAAMATAVAAHSIEYDDVHNASSSHPGVVIFPAALAAASIAGADAGQFLLGCVVGYEVMCRVGRAANPQAHYARHFHPTGTTGHFGAAAAASSILGLDAATATSALGIAGTMAAGSMQFLIDGAWTKRFHPAQAARNGVEAALMAQAGYQGTEDGIGGSRGFLAGYSGDPDPKQLLAEWGDRPLEVSLTSIKAHTCCRYKQGPIDALLDIRNRHGVAAGDVSEIRIGIPSVAVDIVWEPVDAKRHPKTIVDAQFSMPYGAAVAMLRGSASLAEYDGALLDDADVHRLMDSTQCIVDPDLDLTYPIQWRAWAEITTTQGQVYRSSVDDPKGDPANPLDPAELRAKFDGLTSAVYSPDRQDALADAVASLGRRVELDELIGLLPANHAG